MYTEAEASKNEKSILDYIIVRTESRKFIMNTKSSNDNCLLVMEMDINNLRKRRKDKAIE